MFVDDTTKEIMGKERVHKTRATALQSTGKVSDQVAMVVVMAVVMLMPCECACVHSGMCVRVCMCVIQ